MSGSYIGSQVFLISKSNIRYEGKLYAIDTNESTIALAHGKRSARSGSPVARTLI